MKKLFYILPFIVILLISCTPEGSTVDKPREELPNEVEVDETFEPLEYEIIEAYPNLVFDQPLYFTYANEMTDIVYVVERTGKIKYFENNPNVDKTEIFIDLSDKIDINGSEKGLLGLAFHPKFKDNGFFYVNYTDEKGTKLSRYSLSSSNVNIGDPYSEMELLSFPQPYTNHNGGHIEFGPDGYLYIATGDGGSSGDPHNNSQNPTNFYGNILRIDVNNNSDDKPYSIPEDNPFINNSEGYLEEIYAYGLRNPWRFSFDKERGLLIAADVGQDKMEEINIIDSGGNYGWNVMEGTQDFSSSQNVNKEELKLPIWEYDHSLGSSITGGYVYYGNDNPSLNGTYIYGDFISGRIWALLFDKDMNAKNYELLKTDIKISSFGVDKNGELVILDFASGKIYKIREIN